MSQGNIDRHLLLIFDAVFEERNVTRAAKRIEISQSAVSKGLAQLRRQFGDPLFLRTAEGVVPTHRAIELVAGVRRALAALDALTRDLEPFRPAAAKMEFNIATTDYVSFVLLPALTARIAAQAPGVCLNILEIDRTAPEDVLLAGKADLVLSSTRGLFFPLHRQPLFRDAYACVCRKGHPEVEGRITLEQFRTLRHLAMPRQHGGRDRVLLEVMEREGVSRDVALFLPFMLAVPRLLQATDLIMTLARRVALNFATVHPIQVWDHPLPLGDFGIDQMWHDRTHRSPSHQWLRSVVSAVSGDL